LGATTGPAKADPADPGARRMTRHDQPVAMAPHVARWSTKRHAPGDGWAGVSSWHHNGKSREHASGASQHLPFRRCCASISVPLLSRPTSRKH